MIKAVKTKRGLSCRALLAALLAVSLIGGLHARPSVADPVAVPTVHAPDGTLEIPVEWLQSGGVNARTGLPRDGVQHVDQVLRTGPITRNAPYKWPLWGWHDGAWASPSSNNGRGLTIELPSKFTMVGVWKKVGEFIAPASADGAASCTYDHTVSRETAQEMSIGMEVSVSAEGAPLGVGASVTVGMSVGFAMSVSQGTSSSNSISWGPANGTPAGHRMYCWKFFGETTIEADTRGIDPAQKAAELCKQYPDVFNRGNCDHMNPRYDPLQLQWMQGVKSRGVMLPGTGRETTQLKRTFTTETEGVTTFTLWKY